MNNNLNTNDDYYIDDEYNEDVEFDVAKEKRNFNPKIFLIPVGVLIAIVLFVIVVRAISNHVSLELSELYVEGSELKPKFKSSTYNYTLNTEENSLYIGCKTKSKKAKVNGCNDEIGLKTGSNIHEITVSYEKKKKVYKIEIIKEVGIDFEVTGNVENWTSNDVILKIDATSDNPLHEEAYSFDGGETWQKETTKKFSENKEIVIVVRDIEENISNKETVIIDKIDKTVPKVAISNDDKMLTATVTPATAESGYTYQWYKDNKIIDGATSLVYKTNGDGVYKLVVTTGAGKIGEGSYSIKQKYTVTFNSNGGSSVASQTVEAGSTAKKPANPTRSGYTFTGWLLNGKTYNFSTKVTNNITLTASWTKKSSGSSSGGSSSGSSSSSPTTDPSKVTGVKLDKTNITMKVGSSTVLKATVTPTTAANKGLVWESSNSQIATVSQTGQIRAKRTGTITVTVYTQEGNKKATCKVTITN